MIDVDFEQKTKRLILRPFRETDFDVWRETYANLPKPKNQWDKNPRDLKELSKSNFKKVLSTQKMHRKNDAFYDLVAFDQKTETFIGFSSIMDLSRGVFQNSYIGYGVFSLYWGKGYGTEIVKSMLDIAFETLMIHRVEAGIDPANKRSIALAKSLGFRREGLCKRRLYLREKWRDIAIYALTAEEVGITGMTGELMKNRD